MGDSEYSAMMREKDREPSFDAVIPAPVMQNDDLRPNAKLLYGAIRSLCGPYGYCWATNAYFAEKYGMNERSIIRFISQLEKLNFIRTEIVRDKNGRVCGRRIYIVFPIITGENDTLSHMTKKSATCPKSQGEGDQIVSQSLNNNINNNIYARARSSKDIIAVKAELKQWVDGLHITEQEASELLDRLYDFAEDRAERKKPMSCGRCVTILVNRLQLYSDGKVPVMIAMLDNAILRRWDSVYKLREDELQDILDSASVKTEQDMEDIIWL